MPKTTKHPDFFRPEALAASQARTLGEGGVLRLASPWVGRAFWLQTLLVVLCVVLLCICRVSETVRGPAVVRAVGHTEITALAAGVVVAVDIQPGDPVQAGRVMIHLKNRKIELAYANAQRRHEATMTSYLRRNFSGTGGGNGEPLDTGVAVESARRDMGLLSIVAPLDGVVGDVRVTIGQSIRAGDAVMTMRQPDAGWRVVGLLPGHARPRLSEGAVACLRLNGFVEHRQELVVTDLAPEIVGPATAAKLLGYDLADGLPLNGPLVLTGCELSCDAFVYDDNELPFYDGLSANLEVALSAEPIILRLIPWLRRVRPAS